MGEPKVSMEPKPLQGFLLLTVNFRLADKHPYLNCIPNIFSLDALLIFEYPLENKQEELYFKDE